jgi:hypothetical protein
VPARRSGRPLTLALNRAARDPGPSSFAGLSAPLGRPGRDARPQLHRPVRSAGREMSSGRRRKRNGKKAASAIPKGASPWN